MNHNNLIVCKANDVIEAGYKLSLNEQRVVLACIGQVNSMEELLVTDSFELSAKNFAALFSVSEDRAYSELQEVARNLYQRSLTIHDPDPTRPKLKKIETRWISSIGYMPEDGKIVLRFSLEILPFLSLLEGKFTRYKLEHVGKMTCTYAIRLYELLAQWQSVGKREVELDWLKKQLQLDASYERMDNLKARVIEPAIKDINDHSNFNVAWTQRKTGRRVTHLIFTFSEKKPEKLEKLKRKTKATPQTPEKSARKIDNVEYFADLRKKHGDKVGDAVPPDIVEILKAQGRW